MMDDSVELHAPRHAFPTKRPKSEESSKTKRSKTVASLSQPKSVASSVSAAERPSSHGSGHRRSRMPERKRRHGDGPVTEHHIRLSFTSIFASLVNGRESYHSLNQWPSQAFSKSANEDTGDGPVTEHHIRLSFTSIFASLVNGRESYHSLNQWPSQAFSKTKIEE